MMKITFLNGRRTAVKKWLVFSLLLSLTLVSMWANGLVQSLLHLGIFFGIMWYVIYAKPSQNK